MAKRLHSPLTTGIDIQTADMFDGSLNSFGQQTLNSFDQLTGRGESNTLDATISSSVTPALLSNIQTVDVTATAAATLGLLNATGTTSIANDGSSAALTFSNVGASATTVNVRNTSNATTVGYASTTGAQSINLNLANVTAAATITMAGIETVAIASNEAANSVDLELAAATTLTASGSANLTISPLSTGGNTVKVSSLDASAMTGNLTVDMGTQSGVLASTAITVTGGAGNDSIDLSGLGQSYIATGGAGNDTFTDTAITNTRGSIEGGDGVDTLSTTYARASALTTVNGVNGIDILSLSDALVGNLTLANVDSTINTLNLVVNGALNTVASNVTGPAGSLTLNLGTSAAGYAGALGNALTLTDTGSAATDSLTINNLAVNSTTGTNVNVFAGQNVTSAGYENVTISTGTASNAGQTIGTLTITSDSASAPVSLTASGTNGLSVTSLSTNSTGLTTVDASGVNVSATTAGLTLAGTTLGALGTQSIKGSAGIDTVTVGNFAATIDGGAGNDVLTGGTLADSILGGEGNDNLSGAGGNDTIKGEAGNDTINATVAGVVNVDGGAGNDTVQLAATLGATDVVDGGEGTDTLSVTAAITGTTGVGVKNFEILQTSAAAQAMSDAINNSWTTVFADAASVAITNASATLNTYQVDSTATTTHSFARLTDTGTDSLTIQPVLAAGVTAAETITLNSMTADNEESITIDNSAGTARTGSLTITTLNADDITSLTLTGDNAVTITNAIVGANSLATVNAAGLTASASVTAANSTVAVAMTGAAAYANTLTGGVGADSITGGSDADSLTGGNGADTLVGAAGADTLLGGQGADSIDSGTGTDTVTAGTGADSVTLSVDGETDTINQAASDSIAATATNFAGATFAAGDTITFGNGVDVVNNFKAGALASGGDILSIGTINSTSVLGQTTGGVLIGWLSGTYSGGVFTVAANGVGPDTLVLQGSTLSGATTRAVVLAGVDSDNLVDANFSGAVSARIVPLFTANAFTVEVGSTAAQRLYIAADGKIYNESTYTTLDPNAAPNPATGFNQAAMTSVDMSNLLGGFGVNLNIAGATSTGLTSVLGTSGDDVIIQDTARFGAAGSTVNGGAGTDTLRFTSYGTDIVGDAGAGIVSIENIELTAGATSLTMDNTVTSVVAISNQSTSAAATVLLGTGAAHTYTSASAGIDNVTLGLAGQTATLTNGGTNDVVASSVLGASVSTDGTSLAISDLAALAGNYSTSAVAESTLAGAIDGATTVTLGNISGFDVLSVAENTGAVAITAGATNSITKIVADTDAWTFTYNASVAQLDALTSVVDNATTKSIKLAATAAAGGTLNLGGMTLTGVGTLDLGSALSAVTVTGAAAEVDAFEIIAGVGAGGTTTVTTTNDAALDLSTGTFTLIDTLNFAGAGGTNVLTVQAADLVVDNFTAINGTATSKLVSTGAADLKFTTLTGFNSIAATGAGAIITLDASSLSGSGTRTLVAAGAETDLAVALVETGDYTNVSLTASDFASITLSAGVTAQLSSNVLVTGLTTIAGQTTTVESAVINAATATSAISLAGVTTVTHLNSIIVNDGTGANLITTSEVDAVRGITTINLANGGSDQVVIGNAALTDTVLAATIQNFTTGTGAGRDQVQTKVSTTAFDEGFQSNETGTRASITVAEYSILEVGSSFGQLIAPTNANAIILANAAFTKGDVATDLNFGVLIYGGGNAYLYQMKYEATTTDAFDAAELVATFEGVAVDSFAAANFFA